MTIQIKVTDEEMKLLQEAAEKQGVSLEQAAQQSLRAGLAHDGAKAPYMQPGGGNFESCFGIFEGTGLPITNGEIDRLIVEEAMDTHEPKKGA
jgi:hypothetical protein